MNELNILLVTTNLSVNQFFYNDIYIHILINKVKYNLHSKQMYLINT